MTRELSAILAPQLHARIFFRAKNLRRARLLDRVRRQFYNDSSSAIRACERRGLASLQIHVESVHRVCAANDSLQGVGALSLESLQDAKEQIRQATEIVDIVGDYVQLRREGRGYKALCPWHDDRRPSLQVNPERQTFRCFVCNIGGDAFSFIMKMEGVSFPEALALLADRAGISISRSGGGSADAAEEKRLWFQAMAWAEEQFHQCLLKTPEAEPARKYLAERGISDESVKAFRIGFAPNSWDWISKRAAGTRFDARVLETVGLVQKREGGGVYDRFRGRVLFPIRDPQNRPVAIGGRVLPGVSDENGAKYVNSPETPLFTKSNLLYGVDSARQSLSKSKTALIMEGYTDCIVARQNGFDNALAVLGTAVGERHIKLVRRMGVERMVLVLDGDAAGRRRVDEVLELFVAEELDVRVLILPDDLDPCDFLQTRGAEAFRRMIDAAPDALEYKFRSATSGLSGESGLHQSYKAAEAVLATLAAAPRLRERTDSAFRMKEDQILNRLARTCGVAEERLRSRLVELRRNVKKAVRPQPAIEGGEAETESNAISLEMTGWEREFFELLMHDPAQAGWLSEQLAIRDFASPAAKRIFGKLCDLSNRGVELSFSALLSEMDPALQSLLVELDESVSRKRVTDARAGLENLLAIQRGRQEAASREGLTAALRARGSETASDEDLNLLERIIQGERNRQGISAPTDG